MEVDKINFFAIQAKINKGEKLSSYSNRLAYARSYYNSAFLPEKINSLARKLVKGDIESDRIKSTFAIPRKYEKLFKLYLNN